MIRVLLLLTSLLTSCAWADPPSNLLVRESGARISAFSSASGGADLDVLLPPRERLARAGADLNEFVWCTADNAPFPHWVVFEFPARQWITTVVFNNALNDEMAYPGITAREVEIWVAGDDRQTLRRVATFELERTRNGQSVRIAPVQARWLKFVVTRNWGHPTWTELGAFAAYDDGSRPATLAGALDAQGQIDLYGLYFDFGTATLRPESRPVLEEILAYHRSHPAITLLIEGHTDRIGSDAANDALSLARARAVQTTLVRMGVAATRLATAGQGARQPVADNDSPTGRARNRRVTLRRAG